jgi:hypothetical protein
MAVASSVIGPLCGWRFPMSTGKPKSEKT